MSGPRPTSTHTGDPALRWIAVVLVGTSITFALIALLIGPGAHPLPDVPNDPAENGAWTLVLGLCFGVSGLLVTSERPRNPIGWILITGGLLGSMSEVLGIYGTRALADPTVEWPFGLLAIWAAGWLWFPALTLPFAVLPQVYPDGKVVGPRWRWPLPLSLLGISSVALALAASPDNVDDFVTTAVLPFTPPDWIEPVMIGLLMVGFGGFVTGVLSSIAGLTVRFRRGGPQTRGQVLWLAFPAAIGAVTMFTPVSDWTVRVIYPLVAVAVAIGVVGYDLLGINLTVRRMLVYLPMTLAIALVVGGVAAVIAQRSAGAEYGVLIAAVAIAVLVLPMRDVLLRGADRLLYGRRSDPLSILDRMGAAEPVDPEALLAALADSVRSPGIALRNAEGDVLAAVGTVTERAQPVTLGRAGSPGTGSDPNDLGDLLVTPRRGERNLDPSDSRLLAAVAPYVAAALRAQALALEVEAERARVVAATEAERARLRRDLHDGLGPALSGIALGAEAAVSLVPTDQDSAVRLLERLHTEARAATEEVRRVLEDLRPTALDTAPLAVAVQLAAERVAPEVEVEVRGDLASLPPDVATAAYRIAAEALTNVTRHSGASHCQVRLGIKDHTFTLTVRDDGRGLNGELGDAGVGLESMRRRAADLGGRVTISPVQPNGTEVNAVLPLGRAPA